MEFHTISTKGTAHVMTTHRGEVDETPLQLISEQELARLKAIEQAALALAALLP